MDEHQLTSVMVIGGAGGLGASLVQTLIACGTKRVIVVDRNPPVHIAEAVEYVRLDLNYDSINPLRSYVDEVDALLFTAGIGRVAYLQDVTDAEVSSLFKINALTPIEVLRLFYSRINSDTSFYAMVVTSIAGLVSSPLYSVYSATKAALSRFVEAANAELAVQGRKNRILAVAPGRIKGTRFHGETEDHLSQVTTLSEQILEHMLERDELFIPEWETYGDVLARYQKDPIEFGISSAHYKIDSGAVEPQPRVCVGYITGCFDLFHIGHLNVLRRARSLCDYLVVGVHTDGSHKGKELAISLEERIEIVSHIDCVDEVIECSSEDVDDYERVHFNKLFVGDDYKGTERFKRFESILNPKGVEIVYLPYTKGTSSTQLREYISTSRVSQ